MSRDDHAFSVGKVRNQYYWIILRCGSFHTEEGAVAEGFSETKDEGQEAALAEAARLGIEMHPTMGGVAQGFYSRYRARKRKVPGHPETAEFQGEKHLFSTYYSEWKCVEFINRHIITRVTPKRVIVLKSGASEGCPDPDRHDQEQEFGDLVFLDRQELESTGSCGVFYTKDALADRKKRLEKESLERQRRDEEERRV